MAPPIEQVTTQGYDLQFGTNVLGALSYKFPCNTQPNLFLGHFYLTKLLSPALLAGAGSSPDGKARVVNTASSASLFVGEVDFNTLKDTPARKKRSPEMLYSQSKLVGSICLFLDNPIRTILLNQGNVLFSNELARRYGDQGIVSTSLNPGNLQSDIQRHLSTWESLFLVRIFYLCLPRATLTTSPLEPVLVSC